MNYSQQTVLGNFLTSLLGDNISVGTPLLGISSLFEGITKNCFLSIQEESLSHENAFYD